MPDKKTSGIEKVPNILKKPFFTDRLFWFGLFSAAVWIGLFYWLM